MPGTDELRAALAVAELEEELVAAKDGDTDAVEYRDLKLRLREARQAYREQRSGQPAAEGDAVASPDTIEATAAVKGTN